jgi:phenylalanine-4-hydroxylase
MQHLPVHLKKYVVEQNYEKYTSIDQACWRYILRQLKSFLSIYAHECYLEGLEKTGIEIDQIPRIENISAKLEKFGWRALPVSGFIPPAAFMELQSLGVLPIASDMRSIDHLMYTPAPDIVHEAAGHAPILVNTQFADYLRQYATIAKKALISKEDLAVYEAIRDLSDIKENPKSTTDEIKHAQTQLDIATKSITHVSEAAELSRMNWWTAEYGLIGDLESPKIFGAGLLSSVGESKWCLSEKVKKIPLSIACTKQGYDITEPQPQLYVAKDFSELGKVLEQMASQMAFKTGGLEGLNKAIKAETVNTAEFDTGIQISGQWTRALSDSSGELIYVQTTGPTQICINDLEIEGHSKSYHSHGYSTPLGRYTLSREMKKDNKVTLNFASGIEINGTYQKSFKNLIHTFKDCTVHYKNEVLFRPEWGNFDLVVANKISSVYSGPADRASYGEISDFATKRVPAAIYSEKEQRLQQLYSQVRNLRNNLSKENLNEADLGFVFSEVKKHFPQEWLLQIELVEILQKYKPTSDLLSDIKKNLITFKQNNPSKASLVDDGLRLAIELF